MELSAKRCKKARSLDLRGFVDKMEFKRKCFLGHKPPKFKEGRLAASKREKGEMGVGQGGDEGEGEGSEEKHLSDHGNAVVAVDPLSRSSSPPSSSSLKKSRRFDSSFSKESHFITICLMTVCNALTHSKRFYPSCLVLSYLVLSYLIICQAIKNE